MSVVLKKPLDLLCVFQESLDLQLYRRTFSILRAVIKELKMEMSFCMFVWNQEKLKGDFVILSSDCNDNFAAL